MRAFTLLAAASCALAVSNPEEYVDIVAGAKGIFQLSRGNLLPLVSTPWGFNGWSAYTNVDDQQWWWNNDQRNFVGIRCTHRPSPWISDWGHFTFLPMMVGGANTGYSGSNTYSIYNPNSKTSVWKPYHFATDLPSSGNENGVLRLELAPSSHAAVTRVVYPTVSRVPAANYNESRVLRWKLPTYEDTLKFDTVGGVLRASGYTMSEKDPSNQLKTFVVIEVETDATLFSTHFSSELGYAIYDTDGDEFIIKMATSLISEDQAWHNLKSQVGSLTFDEARAKAKAEWNTLLSRVAVTPIADDEDNLKVFYSSFYRASQFPRFTSEYDVHGKEVHFSTYAPVSERRAVYRSGDHSTLVKDGPLVTDSGFWDAYRTVYPWLSVTHTDVLGRMVQGWVNAYQEGGWLPKWASPGYRNSMVSTMGDCVLADAIVNDIGGFNVSGAYDAIKQDAFKTDDGGSGRGREALSAYLEKGYIPHGNREDVSVSLNFYLADYSIAQAAIKLGDTKTANELLERSAQYPSLLHDDGFMRSRDTTGNFLTEFDQYAWGDSYTESGPWQYRFYVPHDPKGLAVEYMKRGIDMCERLQYAMTGPATAHTGGYSQIIHEMTEMTDICWGQYAHDNQPVHHMLYMFGGMSDSLNDTCALRGQYWLRKAVTELYLPSVDMFSGDEDNGEMAAWYLLSSIGLYWLAPGSGKVSLGMPLFREVTITLNNGRNLTVTSNEQRSSSKTMWHRDDDETFPAVHYVKFNNEFVSGTTIDYQTLMLGGKLQFFIKQYQKDW